MCSPQGWGQGVGGRGRTNGVWGGGPSGGACGGGAAGARPRPGAPTRGPAAAAHALIRPPACSRPGRPPGRGGTREVLGPVIDSRAVTSGPGARGAPDPTSQPPMARAGGRGAVARGAGRFSAPPRRRGAPDYIPVSAAPCASGQPRRCGRMGAPTARSAASTASHLSQGLVQNATHPERAPAATWRAGRGGARPRPRDYHAMGIAGSKGCAVNRRTRPATGQGGAPRAAPRPSSARCCGMQRPICSDPRPLEPRPAARPQPRARRGAARAGQRAQQRHAADGGIDRRRPQQRRRRRRRAGRRQRRRQRRQRRRPARAPRPRRGARRHADGAAAQAQEAAAPHDPCVWGRGGWAWGARRRPCPLIASPSPRAPPRPRAAPPPPTPHSRSRAAGRARPLPGGAAGRVLPP
jgi:hypothetical protein